MSQDDQSLLSLLVNCCPLARVPVLPEPRLPLQCPPMDSADTLWALLGHEVASVNLVSGDPPLATAPLLGHRRRPVAWPHAGGASLVFRWLPAPIRLGVLAGDGARELGLWGTRRSQRRQPLNISAGRYPGLAETHAIGDHKSFDGTSCRTSPACLAPSWSHCCQAGRLLGHGVTERPCR